MRPNFPFKVNGPTNWDLSDKQTEDGTWGIYPDGWRDSWYWVFTMLEHIARNDEAAAAHIRERMDALQNEICASGVSGNYAAEICWHTALDLLSEFGR